MAVRRKHDKNRDKSAQYPGHNGRQYKLTSEEYQQLWSSQNGRCAICEAVGRLVIDHCHNTGAVRGLLCFNCNNALGRFRDDIMVVRKAVSYLECPGIGVTAS